MAKKKLIPVSWEVARVCYEEQLRFSVAATTRKGRIDYMNIFMKWIAGHPVTLADFRWTHFRAYLSFRLDLGLAPRTLKSDAENLRYFLRFCQSECYIDGDWLSEIVIPKAAIPYIQMPTEEELGRLLAALHDRWKPGVNAGSRYVRPAARAFFQRRNYAMVAALLDTAARISELLAIRLCDYHADRKQIAFPKTKGGRPRIVPISDTLAKALGDWLRVRPACESEYLFISERGEKLERNGFLQLFKRYQASAGVQGITLHALRHYAITQLAKTSISGAADIAGHTNLVTTKRYVHNDAEYVREVHSQAGTLARVVQNKRSEAARKKRLV
jgi:integrase